MSDHERGAYTPPTDAPLSFEAREPVRGSRPAPVMLILSVLVLLGLAAAIVVFYRSGVRQAGQPPQAVGAPVGDMKGPPPAEAQPQDPAAGLQIYQSETGKTAEAPKFAPPPEQPQPRPQPGPAVTVAPLAPAAAPALRPAEPAAPSQAPSSVAPPKVAAPSPTAVAPKAPPPAAAKAAAPAPQVKVAAATPPKPKPAPSPAAKPEPAPAKPPAAGGAVVQIGAVSSPALADKAWKDALAAAPGLAAGKGKSVEKIDRNGGVLYRTAVTGFASREAAVAFCDKLKTAGKSCFVR